MASTTGVPLARLFRWLIRLFGGLILVSGIGCVLVYYLASRSLPDYDQDYSVPGIGDEIEIVRTNTAVPHIFAQSEFDAFFGLGFAHAQDRLWQITMLRRTAQGRLSELFGMRTLKIDETLRRLDIYTAARQSVAAQDAEGTRTLEAYSAGVNAWIDQVNQGALGRGAPEFFMFGGKIPAWQPADSIAIVKLMSLRVTAHLEEEILRARLSLILPPERLSDILPLAPGDGVADLPDYASLFPEIRPSFAKIDVDTHPLNPLKRRALAGASNIWAAASGRSATSGSLLANDPHLGLSAPSIWYLARLQFAGRGMIGSTIPGTPLILSGRSDSLAWGLTSSYADNLDLHIEEQGKENPNTYRTLDGYRAFETRKSIVRVKDSDPVSLTLRWTENGPVLPADLYSLNEITPQRHVMSISWTALSPNDTTVSAVLQHMRATTIEESIAAGERVIAPAVNIVIADESRIALKTFGALPRRTSQHQSKGQLPSPGWLHENRWNGRLRYNSNPEFVDPDGGIVGNTNNKLIDRPFPFHMSFKWGDTQRIERWRHLMQSREVHTRDSFIEAQLDTISFAARSLLPLVAADLWFNGPAAEDGTPERRRQKALELLAEWNGEMNEHLPEPLIYSAWMRALQKRLIQDDLGPLSDSITHVEPLFIERVFRDVDGASAWCDVVQSTRVETCSEMASLSLDDALLWISERYNTRVEALRWGDAHNAAHDHEVLGKTPLLSWFVNIRQSSSGGDQTLMMGRTAATENDPFLNNHAAGYRGIYDLADPDSSVFVIATGQSGHPLSRYYDDQSELWRRGEYIPMSLDPDLARAAAAGVIVLTPDL